MKDIIEKIKEENSIERLEGMYQLLELMPSQLKTKWHLETMLLIEKRIDNILDNMQFDD